MMFHFINKRSFWAAALVSAAPAVASAQSGNPNCVPPNMLVLFDVSGSMNDANKYSIAQNALHQVTQATESDVRYGLMLFPEPGAYPVRCNLGTELTVPLGLNNWAPIYNVTSPTLYNSTDPNPQYFGGPRGDYDTPMYQALLAAAGVSDFLEPSRRHYVLLLTDGVQDCCNAGDYDSDIDCDPTKHYTDPDYFIPEEYEENRQDLINLVTSMQSSGLSTFVVGFGGAVDATTLDALAQAGGTAIPGCTGTGDCYYQAHNQADLLAALQQITQVVATEVCDGIDNDCDGLIDEDTDQLCETACGSGYQLCSSGTLLPCDAPHPEVEICDGIDNNCDGVVDEGCTCVHQDVRVCGSDVGECQTGFQVCNQGEWGPCEGEVGPTPEQCDGVKDEDCDGLVDEGCKCTEGDNRPCGSHVGECVPGVQFCDKGTWGPCLGGVQPELTDTCGDWKDNDCDGEVDEYCECTGTETRACGSSQGVCEPGHQTCSNGEWGPCLDAVTGSTEVCNLQDDDCDGEIDEGATCPAGATCLCGGCMVPCSDACPGECANGWCIFGDKCPPGTVCNGTTCAEAPAGGEGGAGGSTGGHPGGNNGQGGSGASNGSGFGGGPGHTDDSDDGRALERKGIPAGGCGCNGSSDQSMVGLGLLVGAMMLRSRRRRLGAA